MPSSSIGMHTMSGWYAENACSAPRYVGPSVMIDVARIDEDLREQVERLLRAGGHDEVVGLEAHADLGHELRDDRAELRRDPRDEPYWSACAPS